MIPGMVVDVRDQRIENHPQEQFPSVVIRPGGPSFQLVGELDVGPSRPIRSTIVGIQNRKGANHPVPEISPIHLLPVEPLHQEKNLKLMVILKQVGLYRVETQ